MPYLKKRNSAVVIKRNELTIWVSNRILPNHYISSWIELLASLVIFFKPAGHIICIIPPLFGETRLRWVKGMVSFTKVWIQSLEFFIRNPSAILSWPALLLHQVIPIFMSWQNVVINNFLNLITDIRTRKKMSSNDILRRNNMMSTIKCEIFDVEVHLERAYN